MFADPALWPFFAGRISPTRISSTAITPTDSLDPYRPPIDFRSAVQRLAASCLASTQAGIFPAVVGGWRTERAADDSDGDNRGEPCRQCSLAIVAVKQAAAVAV